MKIVSAAYRDNQGRVKTGSNHPEILDRLGIKGFEDPDSRNTAQFGFVLANGRFVTREQAGPIAEATGQNLKEFEDEEPAHSNEIASPVEPDKPLSAVPQDPHGMPKGQKRAQLAKLLGVPNQPGRILRALAQRRIQQKLSVMKPTIQAAHLQSKIYQ